MNEIKVYDSLTKGIKPLVPQTGKDIKMYVCGMTVYNDCHIGHARIMVTFDIVHRWLDSQGYNVIYTRNITDIDDKIINKANELGIDYKELTRQYIKSMRDDEKELKCLRPSFEPTVTDNMLKISATVDKLMAKGYAYIDAEETGVYFDLSKAKQLGQLSNRTEYTSSDDFALWKFRSDTPKWNGNFINNTKLKTRCDAGRPGWHTECVALSRHYLGDTLDIHGGGSDLLFPHHENEILQAEAITEKPFVNNWMHVGFITVKNENTKMIDTEKMSKSTGNFFTIKDVLKNYKGEVIRYFILNSHYRKQLEYSEHALKQAQSTLYGLYKTLSRVDLSVDATMYEKQYSWSTEYKKFNIAMSSDFNTPEALAVVHGIAKEINFLVDSDRFDVASVLGKFLVYLVEPLGILQDNPEEFLKSYDYFDDENHDEIMSLIEERKQLKANKEYDKADAIRQQTTFKYNVVLEDTKYGTIYHRIQGIRSDSNE